jgi:hypothetical protein
MFIRVIQREGTWYVGETNTTKGNFSAILLKIFRLLFFLIMVIAYFM